MVGTGPVVAGVESPASATRRRSTSAIRARIAASSTDAAMSAQLGEALPERLAPCGGATASLPSGLVSSRRCTSSRIRNSSATDWATLHGWSGGDTTDLFLIPRAGVEHAAGPAVDDDREGEECAQTFTEDEDVVVVGDLLRRAVVARHPWAQFHHRAPAETALRSHSQPVQGSGSRADDTGHAHDALFDETAECDRESRSPRELAHRMGDELRLGTERDWGAHNYLLPGVTTVFPVS